MKKNYQVIFIIILLMLSGLLGFTLSFYQHRQAADIRVIETFHYPTTFVQQLKGDPQAGKKIFQQFCVSCHGNPPIININAPRIGDKKAWKIRRQMGMDTLLKITITGVGAMPARGGCFECGDAQLRAAIDYLIQ